MADKNSEQPDTLRNVKLLYGGFTTVTAITLGVAAIAATGWWVDKAKTGADQEQIMNALKLWKKVRNISAGVFAGEIIGAKLLDSVLKSSADNKEQGFVSRVADAKNAAGSPSL